MHLFHERVRVMIADTRADIARKLLDPDPARTQMALFGYEDVPDATRKLFAAPPKGMDRGAMLLKGFWQTFHRELLPLIPCKSRLLVNPAPGLEMNAGQAFTLTPNLLGQTYGNGLSLPASSLIRSVIAGEHTGYFDDVTIFWDRGVNAVHLLPVLIPRSTLTLVRPRLEPHRFWMGWGDLSMEFDPLLEGISSTFVLKELDHRETENTSITVLGLEGR